MERDYIDKNLLIERYLQGKLSAEEQAAFEEAFLSSGELLNELEAAEKLQQGLQDLAALQEAGEEERRLRDLVARDRAAATAGQRSGLMALFGSPRYAMAASFLLLISLGVSGTLLYRLDRLAGHDMAVTSTQILPVVSVRGTTRDPAVNVLWLGEAGQQFVLMVDPGFEAYSHYRATVSRADTAGKPTPTWQVDGLLPGYEDMLALAIPGSALSPGTYHLEIEGWRDEWPTGHAFEPVDRLTVKVRAAEAAE